MKTFKKIRKSFMAFLLCFVMVLPMAACDKGSATGYAGINDIEFWGTYATESILQDLHGVYDEFKFDAAIDLTVIGGEEEAGKIIMTTGDKPIKEFDVEITDLTCGENKLAKENVDIYQALYTYIGSKEFYKYEGYYPDGLAPIAGTKAVGENNVAANSNQGIYVSFNIPVDQPAGIYKGTLVIKIGQESKNVPVTIEVLGTSISEETHFKSSFSLGWGHERGELDNTFEMRSTYAQALKEHRAGANVIMDQYYKSMDHEVDLYVKWALDYCSQPDAVSFGISALTAKAVDSMTIVYSDGKTVEYPSAEDKAAGKTVPSYNEAEIKKVYGDFAYGAIERYMETGEEINVFAKAYSKGIDEPDLRNGTPAVPFYAYSFSHAKRELIAEILADESIPQDVRESEFVEELMGSLYDLPHILTSWTPHVLYEDGGIYDPLVMEATFCPHYNDSGSANVRDKFRAHNHKNEMWWYGCDTPKAPYPSYHLGNHAISERVGMWMAADYGVVGNLVWATNLYKATNIDGTNYMEDYYDTGLRSRSVPGEGWLFNAGKMYGVDGPIPTLRIKEFKNGIEEWEMIRKLKLLYEEKGFSEHKIMNTLYTTMYSMSKIYDTISCEIFQHARNTMLDLLLLAESEENVLITDFSNARGKTLYNVFVADGYTLGSSESDDVIVSSKFGIEQQAVQGGTLYTLECKDEDAVTILVKDDDGTVKSVSFELQEGSAVFTSANELYNNGSIKPDDRVAAAETLGLTLVNGLDINSAEEMANLKYVQLSVGDAQPNKNGSAGEQSFIIEDSLVSALNNTVDKVQLELYYTGNEDIDLTFTYKGKRSIAAGVKTTLTKGLNRITIDGMKALAWNNIGTIEYLLVRFGKAGDLARNDIYLVGLTVYK